VSLAGRLEEIELAELLHFLALNSRTGKVTLSRRDGHGLIVVRWGRIVYAASSSIRETFGSILVSRGLVTPETLAAALDHQHVSPEGYRIGDILVEKGCLTRVQLQDALKQQIGLVVQELCRWRSGYFRFEVTPVASGGDLGVDAEDLVVPAGVATEQILLEAMTRLDEAEPEPASTASGPRSIVTATFSPVLRAETWLGVVRRAAPVVSRGLLLVVRGDEGRGAGQFGPGGRLEADDLARRFVLPLGEPSLVAEAVERREAWRGAVPDTPANERLLSQLGGERPREAVVVPMLVREGAGLVLYGDNAPDDRAIGPVEELEWALLEAGLAMERDLLEERLRAFERERGYRP
jgi:Domain of unknown function (DUF4388)